LKVSRHAAMTGEVSPNTTTKTAKRLTQKLLNEGLES